MTTQRKPYVRYSVSAEIKDKGIAYAVKQAVNTFLTTHGYEGHLTDLNPSSSSFTAVLELFDNGKYDFNMAALLEHVDNSGRLPTQDRLRPVLAVKPIPVDAEMSTVENEHDNIAYQKTLDSLHRQISTQREALFGKEKTIRDLTSTVTERQQALDQANETIGTLETRLQSASPKRFDTAKSAILNAYLGNGLDSVLDLTFSIQRLQEAGYLQRFLSRESPVDSFHSYLNDELNTTFKSEEEVQRFVTESRHQLPWEQTETAQSNLKIYSSFEANKKVLEIARQNGASEELVTILVHQVEQDLERAERLRESEEVQKAEISKRSRIAERIPELREQYEIVTEVVNGSKKRAAENVSLPVFAHLRTGAKPELVFALPKIEENGTYEPYILDKQREVLGGDVRETRMWGEDSFNFWSLAFNPQSSQEDLRNQSHSAIDTLQKDPLLKLLGITPKISLLEDF